MANVFVFRRDLRLEDNRALSALKDNAKDIVYCFVYDEQQLRGDYASDKCVEFMRACLADLRRQVPLRFFTRKRGESHAKFLSEIAPVSTVAFNADHTPYARSRDSEITRWCQEHDVNIIVRKDEYTLFDFDKVRPGSFYSVFTPFYRACLADIPDELPRTEKMTAVAGSHREAALGILAGLKDRFKKYDSTRDDLSLEHGTTHLSKYMKFGCVSVREVLSAMMRAGCDGLVREVLWREFYAHLAYHKPDLLRGQVSRGGDNLTFRGASVAKWNEAWFRRWCDGTTGFPVVDAAMRQLNETGFMHNRGRMLVASFLTRDMAIDFRHGERYFAQKLIDYDPCSNSGGWQWAAGVGADSQPQHRNFNPWLQSKKHDPDCVYIRRWIPELRGVPASDIHSWHCKYDESCGYPKPMFDHGERIAVWRRMQQHVT